MTVAIFPAAGKGRRMGGDKNKVLIELNGFPILLHTLRRFAECKSVDYFIVIVGKNEVDEINHILKDEELPPYKIVIGGSERQYSVANGLKKLPENTEVVLIHDAARPFVAVDTIERVIESAKTYGAAIAAFPEKNTVKVVENGVITSTPEREKLWAATTPQGFQTKIIKEAYNRAIEDNFLGTDDSSLVERLGKSVYIIEDSYENFKITTKSDLKMAEYMLRGEK